MDICYRKSDSQRLDADPTASQYLSSFLAIMPILKKFSVSTQKYRKDIKILICFESEGKPRDYGTLSGL